MVTVVKPKNREKNITVADGVYPATLSKVSQFSNAYGERIGFEFTLNDGNKVIRSTNTVLSEKSKLAEVITGLMGKRLTNTQIEQGIDLDTLIGTECMLLVVNGASKNGIVYSNVERIYQAQ